MEPIWNGNEQREEKKMHLKPVHGIALFLVVMLCFYTIIAWAQWTFGMYGLALTEIFLLVLSVGSAKLLKAPLREIFPVRKPEWKKLLAVLAGWVSAYAAVIPLTMTAAYFFPSQIFGVSDSLSSFMGSVPLLVSVLISSVMPGICEEALHRGFLLKCFQSKIHSTAGLVLLMGVLFGAFHGSVWRFLPTAFLGGVLTWLMVRTENLVYPALFHFINNFLPSVFAGFSSGQETEAASQMLMQQGLPLSFLGIYFAMACIAPFGIYTASYLLRKGEPGQEQRYLKSNKVLAVLVVLTVLPVILGMLLFVLGIVKDFL